MYTLFLFQLLEVRNFLMHSANHCLTEEALDICFDRMETLLHMEQFNDVHCQEAIIELSEVKKNALLLKI
jgi:hypothetical protein